MRVLFVFNEIKNANQYVTTLKNALIELGFDVTCSVDDFWNNYEHYDIIHFVWLEISLFQHPFKEIIEHINTVKSKCKIIVTCHDLDLSCYVNREHDSQRFLDYIYNNCDAIIHLGSYSYNYLKSKSSIRIKHYEISHHIYDNFYEFSLTKTAARKKLRIPMNSNVILCFGAFRTEFERQMVFEAWKKLRLRNKYLLAPGFFKVRHNIILGYKQVLKALYYKFMGVHFNNKIFISHNDLEMYLCAADIIMIQRNKILNSGNLSLGFSAKKVVVGPNIGNVGYILQETGNPTFDPDDIDSVTDAIKIGFNLKESNLPEKNYGLAKKKWNVSKIAQKHIEVYSDLLNG